MHLTKIEEYSFDHGQHFNTTTGEYHSLNPHTLGRPLTHTEMDYNLIYQKQTLNGFRICGSNNDLTLALSDLGARLQFTQISSSDADWARFQAAGLFDGQFVWNPVGGALPVTTTTTAAPTTTTTTTSTTTTTTSAPPATVSYHAHTNTSWVVPPENFTTTYNAIPTGGPYTIAGPTFSHSEGYIFAGWDTYSGQAMAAPQYQPGDTITLAPGSTTNFYARYDIPVYQNLTATPSPADEGQNIIINLSGVNIPDGRTVGWTITGVDTNDISGSLTGTFTMNSNQAEYIITVTEDLVTEGTETLTLTCATDDNAGTDCGLSVAIDINDTSLTPTTTTVAPTYTVTINAVTNPSNIVGSHPLVQSGLSAGNFTLPGPTWSVTGYTFIGYDTYSGTPMAPPTLQPGDVINITADVNLYARYTLTTTTTTTIPQYTVTFNAGTGVNGSDIVGPHPITQTHAAGTQITIPSPTWTVNGKVFQGYTNVTGALNPTHVPGDSYTVTTNTNQTFYGIYADATTTTTTSTTTTSTTTTSTTTTTTAAPQDETTFYHFHMGGTTYPFTDMMGSGNAFLIGDTTYTAYPLNVQSNVNLIMTDLINNSNGSNSTCTPGTFEFAGPIDGTNGCNGSWSYNVTGGSEWYYLAVPNNASFNVNLVTDGLMQQDCSGTYNASERRAFEYNGEQYWLYKIQNGQDSAPKTFNFK